MAVAKRRRLHARVVKRGGNTCGLTPPALYGWCALVPSPQARWTPTLSPTNSGPRTAPEQEGSRPKVVHHPPGWEPSVPPGLTLPLPSSPRSPAATRGQPFHGTRPALSRRPCWRLQGATPASLALSCARSTGQRGPQPLPDPPPEGLWTRCRQTMGQAPAGRSKPAHEDPPSHKRLTRCSKLRAHDHCSLLRERGQA